MHPILKKIEDAQIKGIKHPPFSVGDTIKVHYRIKEGDKERTQVFQGVVIGKNARNLKSSFTVRKISFGIGVERIFPYYSPLIQKIESVSQGDVNQAKLYYLRKLKGKAARIKTRTRTQNKTKITRIEMPNQ